MIQLQLFIERGIFNVLVPLTVFLLFKFTFLFPNFEMFILCEGFVISRYVQP